MNEKLENYINLSKEEALRSLQSAERGLTEKSASERLQTYGYNEITRGPKRSVFIQSLLHSINPLVGILFIAAGISAFTGDIANASIITIVLLISVTLDYMQSHRSLKAVNQLQSQVALGANVIRDNQAKNIQAKTLVPGDIIRLLAGNLVPADSLLLTSKDLHVQQGALTGESLPIEKEEIDSKKPGLDANTTNSVQKSTGQAIYEASNLIFSGSSIVSGTAAALVLFTGQNTLF